MDFQNQLINFKKNLKKSKTIVTDKYLNQYEEIFEDGVFKKQLIGNKKTDGKMTEAEKEYYVDDKISMVSHNIFISSADAAQNLSKLKESKITHILNLSSNVGKPFPEEFTYECINIADLPDAPLLSILDKSIEFIEKALNSENGNVLVHCTQGVSRSASVLIAYLMKSQNIPYCRAYEITAIARPQICPNYGFEKQLKIFEKSLGPRAE